MRLAALILALWPSLAAADFFTLKGHGGPVTGIAVAPDGRIATASFDTSVGLWTGDTPRWFDGHEAAVTDVIFAGGTLVSAGDDFTLRRWPEGTVLGRHRGKVAALAAIPGLVASASWDGTVGLWPLDGRAPKRLHGHEDGVNTVAFSPDGRRLWSGGKDGTLREWDVATGAQRRVILRHGFGINRIVPARDGRWLAYGAVDGVTRVIDPETGALLRDFTLDRRPILAMALAPDGQRLAVGDGQGYIMVLDTETWRIASDFRATLKGPVWALAYSRDGRNLHAGGLDSAMYSWPVDELAEAPKMVTPARASATADNGERIFVGRCSICHTLTPDSGRRAGPTLHGLFGRRAGTVADYHYSDAVARSGIVWTEESVSALFDEGPDSYIPGTKMPTQRITNPADRADLIAYLRRATAPTEDR